jgi:hypothetical protein
MKFFVTIKLLCIINHLSSQEGGVVFNVFSRMLKNKLGPGDCNEKIIKALKLKLSHYRP